MFFSWTTFTRLWINGDPIFKVRIIRGPLSGREALDWAVKVGLHSSIASRVRWRPCKKALISFHPGISDGWRGDCSHRANVSFGSFEEQRKTIPIYDVYFSYFQSSRATLDLPHSWETEGRLNRIFSWLLTSSRLFSKRVCRFPYEESNPSLVNGDNATMDLASPLVFELRWNNF